ncbi:MAG: LuxR C-terminal-related transcriptional regulator [Acidobacteriia bacterium]|nr:LuxR C-terminal-related transcriptional regulator [Terriglobia bacterium]
MIEPQSRDHELLRMLAQGCSNKEIASFLNVNPPTVKKHLQTLFLELLVAKETAPVSPTNNGTAQNGEATACGDRCGTREQSNPLRAALFALPRLLLRRHARLPDLQVARSRVAQCGVRSTSNPDDCNSGLCRPHVVSSEQQPLAFVVGEQSPHLLTECWRSFALATPQERTSCATLTQPSRDCQ